MKPIDYEISTPLVVDETWSFRHNDERVTYEQYLQIGKDHLLWVAEQEKLAQAKAKVEEDLPKKRKRK